MYPSGIWRGFWEQDVFGRQAMDDFVLRFDHWDITGHGRDIVGRFTFSGEFDDTGRVELIKQYHKKHAVHYEGMPDGEGCIMGVWTIGPLYRGPFLMQPVIERGHADAPILEITK
jgi:hypothetical protein